LPLTFSTAEEHLDLIRQLEEPSMIAVVSISERFLAAARGLLAPLMGEDHSLREYLLPLDSATDFGTYRIVFCDSIASFQVKTQNAVRYRLVSLTTLEEISAAIQSQRTD